MVPDLSSLAWPAVAGYATWKAGLLAERLVVLRERAVGVRSKGDPETAKVIVPDDLIALANQETEEWAKDDLIQSMREKFRELYAVLKQEPESWQAVRRAFGIAEMP
jgi:hypothetical protein